MTQSKQIKKEKPSKLDLEAQKEEKFELEEIKALQDPASLEESRQKFSDIVGKIGGLRKEAEISLKKIYEESKHEKGPLNKIAHFAKRMKDKVLSDGSTSYDSIKFLTRTVNGINEYKKTLPVHIKEFQTAIEKLKQGQANATQVMRLASEKVKKLSKEWGDLKKRVESETNKQKKTILRAEEQDKKEALQNAEIKGNKFMKKLDNYTNTRIMFAAMKESYETLLQEIIDLSNVLSEHLGVLKTVGPSVKEVERVVLAIHRFTNVIDGYRKRDNLTVRYITEAVKHIPSTVQHLENPWFGKKTVGIVQQNAKEGKRIYKQHFGKDIRKLEELETQLEEIDTSQTGDAEKVEID